MKCYYERYPEQKEKQLNHLHELHEKNKGTLKRKEYDQVRAQQFYQRKKEDPAHKHMVYRQSANQRKLEFTLTLKQFTLLVQ